MSDEKYVNIARLMTSYNFEFKELPDNLKCTKCKLVLKDACQVPCGCTFCRVCINDMIMKDGELCPGPSEYCAESSLPLFKSDYKSNNSVSKLSVKCPHYGCVHECQLINIEEHMRECQRRNVECPFRDFGCMRDKLIAEEVDLHWQQDYRRHCEILIGMVANINRETDDRKREIENLKQREEENRREIEILKQREEENRREIDILNASDESHRREIEMLNQINQSNKKEIEILNETDVHSKRKIEIMNRDLIEKAEQIKTMIDQMDHVENENKSIRKELKSFQEENENLAVRVRVLTGEIEHEINDRRENDEIYSARVIEHIDKEISEITKLIGSNKDNLEIEVQTVRNDIQSFLKEVHSGWEMICSLSSQVQSIQVLVGQVDARYEWLIGEDVGVTNSNKAVKRSEQFKGERLKYEYQLVFANSGSELCIGLCIYSTKWYGLITSPFEGRVVITVADINRRDACRSISRQCKIDRPSNNDCSEYFKFRHSELRTAGLDLHHGVCVSCIIVPSHLSWQ